MILVFLCLVIVTVFACVIYGLSMWSNLGDYSNLDRQCISGIGQYNDDGTKLISSWFRFMDVFTLSWTTFTTVGYGNVFPSSRSSAEQVRRGEEQSDEQNDWRRLSVQHVLYSLP